MPTEKPKSTTATYAKHITDVLERIPKDRECRIAGEIRLSDNTIISYDLSLAPIEQQPKKPLNRWDDEGFSAVLKLKRQGMTTEELAKHYGLAISTMRKRIYTAKCLEEYRASKAMTTNH